MVRALVEEGRAVSSKASSEVRIEAMTHGVAHAILTAVAVWFASALAPRGSGLPIDEAWVHQALARTLVESGSLALVPGQHDWAYTSPLWDILLAINFSYVKIDPARWAFGVNVALHVASVNMVYALVARDVPRGCSVFAWRLACLGGAVAIACSADLVGYVASGCETTLFIALVLGSIWLAARDRFVAAGILGALAGLTRPEGVAVGLLVAVFAIAQTRNKKLGAGVAAPAVVVGGILWALVASGRVHLATTMWTGRHWAWFETSAGLPDSTLRSEIASAWITRLSDSMGFARHQPALVWIACGLAAYGALRIALVRGTTGARLLLAWGVIQTWFMFRYLISQGPGGAWQPFVPILFVFCTAVGSALAVWDLAARAGGLTPRLAGAGALVAFVWAGLGYEGLLSQGTAHHLAVADLEATLLEMGARIDDTLPDSAVVASFDSGALAYVSHDAVVDIGRLANDDVALLVERGRSWEYLKQKGVTHVVLPEGFASRLHLDDNPAVAVKPVSTLSALSRSFTLYEISYTGGPAPRRVLPARWANRGMWDDARMLPRRDRLLAEHMLGILAEWDVPVQLAILGEPRPIGGGIRENTKDEGVPCAIQLGRWGVDADECELVGPTAKVRAALVDELKPYIDASDLGGAARAIPHILTRIRRSTDERFVPLLPPSRPAAPGGKGGQPWVAPWWGIAMASITFLALCALGFYAKSAEQRSIWIQQARTWLRTIAKALRAHPAP